VVRGQCVELGADGMALVPLVEVLRTLTRTTPRINSLRCSELLGKGAWCVLLGSAQVQ
jgi:hypothetical protein